MSRDRRSRARRWAPPTGASLNRFREAFEAELDTFIVAVRGTATPPATLDDGVAALRIAEAAIRSVRDGRPIALEVLP